jgi:hypothetical protein
MNGSFYVELAPGEVSLSVGYSGVSYFPAALQYSTDSPTVSFTAESGHEYVLDVELSADRWQPTLLDSTTHKQIH